MPLSSSRLANKIKLAFIDADENGGDNREDQLDYFCNKLATEIINEIKDNLKINYTSGLVVGSNPVTGTFNHTTT